MSRGFSTYLDLLRFSAAVIVFLSHYGYQRMSEGRWYWLREWNLGSDAVIVFFVLSGFVIAHVAARPGAALGGFAFDRLSRLISVALPALVLGYALDRLGASIAPQVYANWFYNPLPLSEQLLRGLSFTNEWGQLETRLGTNGPFWSISYEAAYYALFAVAFFLRGQQRLALLLLIGWLVGLNILLLLPVWLMGVALHALNQRGTLHAKLVPYFILAPVPAYLLAQYAGLPQWLLAETAPIHRALNLRFSDEFLWNTFLGVLVAMHLRGMFTLLASGRKLPFDRAIKWLAGASFSIYLVHYPLLQFLSVLELGGLTGWTRDAVVLGIALTVSFAFAALFERPLHMWRALARRVMPRAAARQA